MAVGEFSELVRKRVEDEEAEVQAGFEFNGREFLGREKVLAASPYDTPTTKAKRRTLNPRVACTDKWRRIAALQTLKRFVEDYRAALERYRVARSPMNPERWLELAEACRRLGREADAARCQAIAAAISALFRRANFRKR